jgi:hypothetical protein
MPTWTLRLVACAGFVALLSRLPALYSVTDTFLVGAVTGALALAAHFGPTALRALRGRLPLALHHPVLTLRSRSVHGADA